MRTGRLSLDGKSEEFFLSRRGSVIAIVFRVIEHLNGIQLYVDLITPGDQMFEMIGLQDIQGYWTLSKEVARLLGVQVEMIKSAKINKVRQFCNINSTHRHTHAHAHTHLSREDNEEMPKSRNTQPSKKHQSKE